MLDEATAEYDHTGVACAHGKVIELAQVFEYVESEARFAIRVKVPWKRTVENLLIFIQIKYEFN